MRGSNGPAQRDAVEEGKINISKICKKKIDLPQ